MGEGKFVVVEGGNRDPDLRAQYERHAAQGTCPFCEPQFSQEHKSPILRQGEHWVVTPCDPPRKELGPKGIHILVISKRHINYFKELDSGAGEEMFDHLRWVEAEFGLTGFSVAMRCGTEEFNGAGIKHFHLHVMQGDTVNPPAESFKFKVFDPSRINRNE